MSYEPDRKAQQARMAEWVKKYAGCAERFAGRMYYGPPRAAKMRSGVPAAGAETYTRGTVVSSPGAWKDSLNLDSMTQCVGHNVARDRKSEAVYE